MLLAPFKGSPLCVNCSEAVDTIYVACAECSNVELCLQCFSFGAEPSSTQSKTGSVSFHVPSHRYCVRSTAGTILLDRPVLHDGKLQPSFSDTRWTADSELALLDALTVYGIGNWQITIDCMKSALGKEQNCQGHSSRVGACGAPSVDRNQALNSLVPKDAQIHYEQFYMCGRIGMASGLCNTNGVVEMLQAQETEADRQPSVSLRPSGLTADDARKLTYEEKRCDFGQEYNDGIERILNSILPKFSVQNDSNECAETAVEKELLASVARIYRDELKERHIRRRIAQEYGLLKVFSDHEKILHPLLSSSCGRSRLTAQKSNKTRDRLRKFCKFLKVSEFSKLVSDIRRARDLRRSIKDSLTELKKRRVASSSTKGADVQIRSPISLCSNADIDTVIQDLSVVGDGNNNASQSQCQLNCLSDIERNFCVEKKINFHDYFVLKALFIQEYINKRSGVPVRRSQYTFNDEHFSAVHDYLVSNKIISQ